MLGLFDVAAAGLADWSEFDAEAERFSIEVCGLSRQDLRALIEGSTREIPTTEGGGEGAPQIYEGAATPVTEVLEYRPHEDGYLQLELRRYIRQDGSARERGPYWYFQFHEGGKRKKLYLGKTSDPESTLADKRSKPLGE
jgi:hypothetical protein